MTKQNDKAREPAKFEEWPLSKNWWLHIQSERGVDNFEKFDFIKIEAHGPDNYKRSITTVMVPRIDGFVCESHSFISYLINQNLESIKSDYLKLQEELAEKQKLLDECEKALEFYDRACRLHWTVNLNDFSQVALKLLTKLRERKND